MIQPDNFKIEPSREFPHLPGAPIVEAVIHWRASPGNVLERDALKNELEGRFSGYSLHEQQRIQAAFTASADGLEASQHRRWGGFRLTSADQKYVCQVTPTAVVFSRLSPYEDWSRFAGEALRFWDGFVELATPVALDRLGVRFINQIELSESEQASDVVNEPPALPESIGLRPEAFFRQDTIALPGYPYRVNLVRAIQGPDPPLVPRKSLFVDIDVFTREPITVDRSAVDQHLNEMRFVKNWIFFNFVKDAEKRFAEQTQ